MGSQLVLIILIADNFEDNRESPSLVLSTRVDFSQYRE